MAAADAPPNVVIILADDLGYGDRRLLRRQGLDDAEPGSNGFRGGEVHELLCCAAGLLGESRGLMTGCYPNRVGIHGRSDRRRKSDWPTEKRRSRKCSSRRVTRRPRSASGISGIDRSSCRRSTASISISGCRTPTTCGRSTRKRRKELIPRLPLIENENGDRRRGLADDQETLTRRYTEKAVQFIAANKAKPFFLYFAHSFPHVPLYAGENSRVRRNRDSTATSSRRSTGRSGKC